MIAVALTMVAIKEVNTVGAPSYTSGVQKWNGAADTLKLNETKIKINPADCMSCSLTMPVAGLTLGAIIWKVPVAP